MNGFIERFSRTMQEKFFAEALHTTHYESIAALQTDLNAWLVFYNTNRLHLEYCPHRCYQFNN